LSALANGKEWVSKNTQNLALQSVCYLFREIIKQPLVGVDALRAKRPDNVREVVDQSELVAMFGQLRGVGLLAAQMMYGCGLRIGDLVKIRIKDLSFERCQIHIHSGKGDKSRYVPFPKVLHDAVRTQVDSMLVLHGDDVPHCPMLGSCFAQRRRASLCGRATTNQRSRDCGLWLRNYGQTCRVTAASKSDEQLINLRSRMFNTIAQVNTTPLLVLHRTPC
jgi:integrase